MLKIMEYDHEKLLEVFKTINDFAAELLVDPQSIDFLSPYILLTQAPLIPELIPIIIPKILTLDEKFPQMNDSQIIKSSEQRIQLLEELIIRFPNMTNIK